MRRILGLCATALTLASVMLACQGSESNPIVPDPIDETGPFNPMGPAGEPSELDWATLGGQFGAIGVATIQQSLASSNGTFAGQRRVLGTVAVDAPVSDVAVSAAFLCCGSSASSHLAVSGDLRPGAGTVGVALDYSSDGPLRWTSASGTTWLLEIESNGLAVTATLSAQGGRIAPTQEFRLIGSVTYVLATGEMKTAMINLSLLYPNLDDGAPPNGMGRIGPLEFPFTPLPPASPPERCSRPQEGCGPLVSGPCPCTSWPPCPVYGLSGVCSG